MTMHYRLDPAHGRFSVHAFATGILSILAHSPTFAVRDFQGRVCLDDGAPGRMTFDIVVKPGSLILMDRVPPADRRDIEGRMRGEVLEISAYPEIRYEAKDVSSSSTGPGRFRLRINGRLSLHGVTRPHPIDAEMRLFGDGLQLVAGFSLWMSDFHIKPVTALRGAIKRNDELKVSSELVGLPEGS
jgi:polyisoprenoid-binding protein YceI